MVAPQVKADDQTRLEKIHQNIASKERQVRQQQRQREDLLKQLKQQEQEIATLSQTLQATQQRLTQLQNQMEALNVSVSQLETRQKQEKQALATQLDAAFRLGKQGAIQSLLMGEDSLREQRLQVYYQYLSQVRQQAINDLRQTQQQLAGRQQELAASQLSQRSLLERQKSQQVAFEQVRQARKQTLKQLDSSIQQGQQQLAELRHNEAQLRESIARAEAAARQRAEREAREAAQVRQRQQEGKRSGKSYQPTPAERDLMARTGGLGKPDGQAYWPVKGLLLHHYGDIVQGELRWKGIVIAASSGTKVQAIAEGRVILVDWLQGYGLVIVIEHGKGDMSLYGYNQSAMVQVGDSVRAGQDIALVGDSGGQGQSALYFEIRRQGQAVNPLPWFRK